MERMKDKIVLVSGAAGGIGSGSGIRRRMASEGAAVLVADIAIDGAARRAMMADTMKSVLDVSFVERNGALEDTAALATFVASAEAGFMNGENVVCDGGH
jgi:NAD(P)-dependent dehydrogenase (short-subunit alcohol dehydrogenase family)